MALRAANVVKLDQVPAITSVTRGPGTTTLTLTNDAELIAAPGAGLAIFVTSLMVGNTSATLTRVDIKEGTTIRISQPLAASGGGFSREYNPPWQLPADTALNGALGTAVTDVRVNVHFYVDRPRA